MNKPIRTISLFCLFLFLALMVNATWLQYAKSQDYANDPRNRRIIEAAYSAERGAILVGRDPVAESVPVDDKYEFLREYPEPEKYAHVTGYFSYFSQTGIEQTQNRVLSGDDDLLFVTKLVDLLSGKAGKGGNVQLTIDRAAQDAAYDCPGRPPRADTGAPVRGARSWRSSPTPARSWRWRRCRRSTPTSWPRTTSRRSSRTYERLRRGRGRAAGQPGDPDHAPARARRSSWSPPPRPSRTALYEATDEVPGGATYQLPQTTGSSGLIDNEGRDCGVDMIPFEQAMGNSCNTTFAQLGVQLGAEKMQEQAEAFGFNQKYFEDLGPQSVSNYPERREPAGDRPVGHRAVRGAGHPPADGHGRRRDRQPGHGHAALPRRRGPVADVRGAPADRSPRSSPRRSPPRPRTS